MINVFKFLNEVKSCQQQSLKMRIVSTQECSSYYTQGYSVEICAIGDEMPCSGYSGSPLLYRYGDNYYLVRVLYYFSSDFRNFDLFTIKLISLRIHNNYLYTIFSQASCRMVPIAIQPPTTTHQSLSMYKDTYAGFQRIVN